MVSIGLLGFYVGTGYGHGLKMKSKIAKIEID